MPRHPKPTPLRANRERRDIGLIALSGPLSAPPPAPPGLLAQSQASWATFWSSPLARTVIPETDLDTLRRLWSLKDERERMYRAIQKERMTLGSRRQVRANPLYPQMVSLDSAIERLEGLFGLSPKSRLQLGVVLGDAARSLADLNADLEADEDLDALLTEPVDGSARGVPPTALRVAAGSHGQRAALPDDGAASGEVDRAQPRPR